MALGNGLAIHRTKNINIKQEQITKATGTQKQALEKELTELKANHTKHVEAVQQNLKEQINQAQGEAKEEFKKNQEELKSKYVAEQAQAETINSNLDKGGSDTTDSNDGNQKGGDDSDTTDSDRQNDQTNTVKGDGISGTSVSDDSSQQNGDNQANTETNIEKDEDENKAVESDNTLDLDETNGSTTPINQDKVNEQHCIDDIEKLVKLYDNGNFKKSDVINLFPKDKDNKTQKSVKEHQSVKSTNKAEITQDYCVGTKFEEIYKNLKQQMHDIGQEKQAKKQDTMKDNINKIIKNYYELKKNTEKVVENTVNKDSEGDNGTSSSTEHMKYYYDIVTKLYKACDGQGFELMIGYLTLSYSYTKYYNKTNNQYLKDTDKFYTDSNCTTEVNRNLTKIYYDENQYQACDGQGLTLQGSTKSKKVDIKDINDLKIYPEYYDYSKGDYLTKDNIKFFDDDSCKDYPDA